MIELWNDIFYDHKIVNYTGRQFIQYVTGEMVNYVLFNVFTCTIDGSQSRSILTYG